ncbi:MAG: ABC transporter permease [Mycobacterium sp.]
MTTLADGSPLRRSPRKLAALLRSRPTLSAAVAGLLVLALVGVGAGFLAPFPADGTWATHPDNILQAPGAQHWFGTDHLGRDVLSRVIFGARTSLLIVVGVLVLAALVGVLLGTVAGYYGGWVGSAVLRTADVFLAFPALLLTVVLVTVLGVGLWTVVVAVAVAWWPWYARSAAAMARTIRTRGYVDAARCLGLSDPRILLRHVLPNTIPPVLVQLSIDAGTIVVTVAALSYLGVGVQEPTSEWGLMIQQGLQHLNGAWWIGVFPGIAVVLTALCLFTLGESMRQSLVERGGS